MAKVDIFTKEAVTEVVVIAPEKTEVVLRLSVDEALYVTALLGTGNASMVTNGEVQDSPYSILHNALIRLDASYNSRMYKYASSFRKYVKNTNFGF